MRDLMEEDKEKDNMNLPAEEQEIDLLELARNLWDNWRLLLKWLIGGAIVGLIIALSIPKEYTTTIKLVSENSGGATGASGGLGMLASMAGISPTSVSGGKDAVSPLLYPDIVKSAPFVLNLFDVKVTDIDDNQSMTVKEYVSNDISYPWWSILKSLPGKAINGVMSIFSSTSNDNTGEEHNLDPFDLTPQETGILNIIASRISANYDNKTAVISISVTMQDPKVSAMLADTVANRLKEYVINYRTNKARSDLEFAEKLNNEAKADYFNAQKKFATYNDRNHGIVLNSAKTEGERLRNEMQLAYNLYNSTSQQLQVAKAKVQEITPVFTVLEPATVPRKPVKPSKMIIIFGCAFVAFVIAAAWVLFGKSLVRQFKEKGKNQPTE